MAQYVETGYWDPDYTEEESLGPFELDPRFIATARVVDHAVAVDAQGNIA